MYRSNRSLLFKFPPTRAKLPFKCPTLGSIQVIKCPHPGDISQAHINDRRTAERCAIFCKFHKNHRVFWGPLHLPFHSFKLFSEILNFAEISNFFLICSFHKKHIFSSGLPYLPFYCVSVTQWIFQFFVIFAKFVCKTWTYLIRSFQCDPTAVNNIWDTPARKLAVWYSWCLVYPSKTKTQISRQ